MGAVRREDRAHEKGERERRRNEDPEHGEPGPCREGRSRRMPADGEQDHRRDPRDRQRETQCREHGPEATIGPEEEERRARGPSADTPNTATKRSASPNAYMPLEA